MASPAPDDRPVRVQRKMPPWETPLDYELGFLPPSAHLNATQTLAPMKFMNDWIGLALAIALLAGGLVAGRRLGAISALWLASACWLAFRLADTAWRSALMELRVADPDLDVATWVPLAYGMLFLALLLPSIVGLLLIRPGEDVVLPGKAAPLLGAVGGLAMGTLLFLGLVQAHVRHPVIQETMPGTLGAVTPVLRLLGQKEIGGGGAAGSGSGAGAEDRK